jgi:flagellar L-ring protein precursor FlgH
MYVYFRQLSLIFGLLNVITACSTHIENLASEDFEPVIPKVYEMAEKTNKTGAIYKDSGGGLFATDRRASHVGDILTVALTEDFAASKSQSASAAKTDSFTVDLPAIIDAGGNDANLTAGGATTFSGTGAAAQRNSLRGQISVTVTKVFNNGNMEIIGQKQMQLNNGDEYIRLSGIVRPEDINADNIIVSNRIANAQISYLGAGDTADTGKKGWLSRALSTISPL